MKLTAGKCFVAYWVIALLTFGYSASGATCDPGILRHPEGNFCKATTGLTSGAFWPLYWTWEGFATGRQAMKGGDA
ncbi:hypothetical protein D3C80_797830 [compost metagenome]